jgi:AcrR family transcriptional regulator
MLGLKRLARESWCVRAVSPAPNRARVVHSPGRRQGFREAARRQGPPSTSFEEKARAMPRRKPSLRERKKQQTKAVITGVARRLFDERGFDKVSVAEIAREADVSEGTVFNYFPTKEHLFFDPVEAYGAHLVEAVRDRSADVSALEAFRDALLKDMDGLESALTASVVARHARLMKESTALQNHERAILAEVTNNLADARAETANGPDLVEPMVVAQALMGVQRAVMEDVHSQVLSGVKGRALAKRARAKARVAFGRLEAGLEQYGRRAQTK